MTGRLAWLARQGGSARQTLGWLSLVVALGGGACGAGDPRSSDPPRPRRYVEGNAVVSQELPALRVRLADAFAFVGRRDFTLGVAAHGERFYFVDAAGEQIRRLVVVQFEEYFPSYPGRYVYPFADPVTLGGHRFDREAFAFSNREESARSPVGDAAASGELFGFRLADALMMARFVTVPDAAGRHEMLVFYFEGVAGTGRELDDFYDDAERPTPLWREQSAALLDRARESFAVE